jgi:5'-3' exonuclease
MGIRYLNKYLKSECDQNNGINLISLNDLSGKKIVVDINIYLYKYVADNSIIENMYLMLSTFKKYNIIPLFVFDGKPPIEKTNTIKQRQVDKKNAKNEYNEHNKNLIENNENYTEKDKLSIINKMNKLKKKIVYVNQTHINNVKHLIKSFGALYYDAIGESDELCAALVIENKAWGCLSEDMDMFMYGCNNIVRYLSLLNHTAVVYNVPKILQKLQMSQTELREVCVLSGTDYSNINESNINNNNNNNNKNYLLPNVMELFKKYKKHKKINDINDINTQSFYNWVFELKNINYNEEHKLVLNTINNIFNIKNSDYYNNQIINNIQIEYVKKNDIDIKEVLKNDGFIF